MISFRLPTFTSAALACLIMCVALHPSVSVAASPSEQFDRAINSGKKAFSAKQYKDAERHFLAAATIGLGFGNDDERHAAALDHLGATYAQLRKYKEAESTLKQALELITKRRDRFHPDLLATLQNLSLVQRVTKQWDAAVETSLHMLQIIEATFGKDHLNVAAIESNLAAIEQQRSEYAKAEKHLTRSLEIRKAQLKEGDPLLGQTYRDLGNTCLANKNFDKAETWYTLMLANAQKASPDSLEVADSLQKMAQVYEFTKNFKKALPLIQRAHGIRAKLQSKDHLDVGKLAFTLARLYVLTKEFKSAEHYSRSAMHIFRQKLGDQHAFYVVALLNHSSLLESTGRKVEAKRYLKMAHDISTKSKKR